MVNRKLHEGTEQAETLAVGKGGCGSLSKLREKAGEGRPEFLRETSQGGAGATARKGRLQCLEEGWTWQAAA
jgi:hypothetical protein